MNLKKILSGKTVRLLSLVTLLQGMNCVEMKPKDAETQGKEKTPSSLVMTSLTPQQEKELADFMKDYASKSPSARKLLEELAFQGASLYLFDKEADKDNLFQAGESDENGLGLNKSIKEKGVSLENTFFHEAEHVVHLKRAHNLGINASSFSSLNDVYIYASLLEALAYRKAALCCAEYEQKLSPEELQKMAQEVFEKRFLTKGKDKDERLFYEKKAIMMANSDTKKLPNQVYFGKKTDWNKIVSLLSRGEIKEVSALPQPTLTLLGVCLLREIRKNPAAEKLEDLGITCVLKNKSDLQKDEQAIKVMISELMMETYTMCLKTKRPFPQKTYNDFLKLIGWPDKKQLIQIKQGKTTLKKVRDFNLKQFETGALFDEAEKLLKSPEVKAFNVPDMQVFSKILHFEKMILVPRKTTKLKRENTKTR